MAIHFGFYPDPRRAVELDRRMHSELAASCEYLADQGAGLLQIDAPQFQRLLKDLRASTVYPPRLFADYYALVQAMVAQDVAGAQALIDAICRTRPMAMQREVVALQPPEASDWSRCYLNLLEDPGVDLAMLPPSAAVFEDFRRCHADAMAVLRDLIPELAGEIDAIVHQVVCVSGDASRKVQFDGGSHFQLWGALFLNADMQRSLFEMIEVLAHESAHSLLFGFCTEQPLVFNDDDTLFNSPLRRDPRPMDGIYHATFVSARMHWAMSQLLAADTRMLLTDAQRHDIRRALEADVDNFRAGYEVVARHAELSDLGAELMANALAYMDDARQ